MENDGDGEGCVRKEAKEKEENKEVKEDWKEEEKGMGYRSEAKPF